MTTEVAVTGRSLAPRLGRVKSFVFGPPLPAASGARAGHDQRGSGPVGSETAPGQPHVAVVVIGDPRHSGRAREVIQLATASVFVSAASVWEIAIMAAKGKLRLPSGAEDRVKSAMASAGFVELPVTWDHACAVRSLNAHHLDPFDRLLIVQSRIEGFDNRDP